MSFYFKLSLCIIHLFFIIIIIWFMRLLALRPLLAYKLSLCIIHLFFYYYYYLVYETISTAATPGL
jgi:uncharacterized RDD family membrane protein YckC